MACWYAFDKYYSVIDYTGAYTAAILLYPSLCKTYLQAAWRSSWITTGVLRAKALWQQYKKDNVVLDTGPSKYLTAFEQFQATIAAKQRTTKSTSTNEFERFISAPQEPLLAGELAINWWLQP